MKKCLMGVCKTQPVWLLRPSLGRWITLGTRGRFSTWLPITVVNKNQSGISITLPGYSYGDLDRHGNVSIHKVSTLGEATRMSVVGPQFSGLPSAVEPGYRSVLGRLYDDRLIFAVTANYDIKPAFYDKEHLFNTVISADTTVNVGKTSFQNLNTTTSEKTGRLLHTSLFQLVVVDKNSHRPVPLPEYFVEHFKSRNTKVPFERIVPVEKPKGTTIRQYNVRWSDTDYYFHLNQANYIRICFDTLVEVSRAGLFSVLAGDLGRYRVNNYKCYYQNEAVPGDVLDIHMWENLANPMIVHAIAEKEGTSIFQCSFEFVNPKEK